MEAGAFKKDYLEMVSPRVLGMPDWDKMRERLCSEFEPEGAHLVSSGDGTHRSDVVLPECVWEDFRAQPLTHRIV